VEQTFRTAKPLFSTTRRHRVEHDQAPDVAG
jgi:hypothetical protein